VCPLDFYARTTHRVLGFFKCANDLDLKFELEMPVNHIHNSYKCLEILLFERASYLNSRFSIYLNLEWIGCL